MITLHNPNYDPIDLEKLINKNLKTSHVRAICQLKGI